jgi:hypothetical protein
MTNEELSEYLKSIGGLKIPYKKNIVLDDVDYFQCSSGWNKLLKDLIDDLIKLGWNKEIEQVKEKFGGLRFYINEGSNEIYDRINIAEKESYTICEKTGKPGELRTDIGWWSTLSDEEYLKIKNKNGI